MQTDMRVLRLGDDAILIDTEPGAGRGTAAPDDVLDRPRRVEVVDVDRGARDRSR